MAPASPLRLRRPASSPVAARALLALGGGALVVGALLVVLQAPKG